MDNSVWLVLGVLVGGSLIALIVHLARRAGPTPAQAVVFSSGCVRVAIGSLHGSVMISDGTAAAQRVAEHSHDRAHCRQARLA